ncbi:hypothetical protein ACFRJ1_19590 [Streptomyces sp. NPDC056773]|uniref:hypothetical protein n=1 Tax=unclassified Streptomyces TaxID=2593676 RepID=UPI00368A1E15
MPVGQTVEGLLGVTPDAPARTLSTGSRLPSGMVWLRIDDLRIGDSAFALRHDGASKSTLTVDGVPQSGRIKVVNGVTYTYATPTVEPGRTVTVTVRTG